MYICFSNFFYSCYPILFYNLNYIYKAFIGLFVKLKKNLFILTNFTLCKDDVVGLRPALLGDVDGVGSGGCGVD